VDVDVEVEELLEQLELLELLEQLGSRINLQRIMTLRTKNIISFYDLMKCIRIIRIYTFRYIIKRNNVLSAESHYPLQVDPTSQLFQQFQQFQLFQQFHHFHIHIHIRDG
jgi:hypothetical protein